MDTTEIFVLVAGSALIAFVIWYFLMSEGESARAQVSEASIQRVGVTVRSGYSPDHIVVKRGVPVELSFYRDETSSCSEQVVFGDFQISRKLPAFETTRIRFTPEREGEYTFTCGMSMLRGKLIVEA